MRDKYFGDRDLKEEGLPISFQATQPISSRPPTHCAPMPPRRRRAPTPRACYSHAFPPSQHHPTTVEELIDFAS